MAKDASSPNPAGEIFHIDLDAHPAALDCSAAEALLVFWRGDRPVGKLQVKADGDRIALDGLAERAINPAALDIALSLAQPPSGGVSVVICTRDRPDDLARCLASLKTQSLAADEILVVDNASVDDRTRQAAMAANVSYVREERPGLDFARNRGAMTASGTVIVYTDDDVEFHPRWLERLVGALEGGIMGVTGLVLPKTLAAPAQLYFEEHSGFGRGFVRQDFGADFYRRSPCKAWELGAGASMAFRREVFDRIGYFDERLGAGAAGCSDDSEFWNRMLANGMTLRYEPSSVAYHTHRGDNQALARQYRAYMRGHAAALLIQFERHGRWSDLARLLLVLPGWYLHRAYRKLRGWAPDDLYLGEEVAGWAAGVLFYLRTPRSAKGPS